MYKTSILTAQTPSLHESARGTWNSGVIQQGMRQAGKRFSQYNTCLLFCQSPESEIPHTFSFTREENRASPYRDVPVFLYFLTAGKPAKELLYE
jgi:hypothetical protein